MAVAERYTLNLASRVYICLGVALLSFTLLSVRLWYLQVVKGPEYKLKSENNRAQTLYLAPPRGALYDRNGTLLVNNRPSFNIELVSEDTPSEKRSLVNLARVVGAQPDQLIERSRRQRSRRPFEPKLILKDVSRDVVAKVKAAKSKLAGIKVTVVPARNYLLGDFASHAVGYIREITEPQLQDPQYASYLLGDLIGQAGVEKQRENFLQGQRGRKRIIVNAFGVKVGEIPGESQPEISGHALILSLDARVQRAADTALSGKKGAIVALNAKTGEIVAMSSSSRFDPNIFIGDLSRTEWLDLKRENKLMNKTIQGVYPPGSVFKIFMSVAALSEKITNSNERVFCPGSFWFAGRAYNCHKKTGHGTVELKSALIQSCDVYYYTMGQRLGVDRIHKYATMFGLGEKTGIDLPNESKGLIPSTEWKRVAFRNPEQQKWFAGETLSVAIGQGAVTTSPVQIARGLAAVVNGGKVLKPRLVKRITSEDGRVIDGSLTDQDEKPEVIRQVDLDPKVIELVKDAMVGVVNDPRGTAHRAQLDKSLHVTVGGKTGTAQVVGLHHQKKGEHLDDHAWFAGYAPANDPQLVVVALVENGGHGGSAAAPLVRQTMQAYFHPEGEKEMIDYLQSLRPPLPEELR